MADHQNGVNTIAVIIDVQDLLTEATRALLDRDWRRASNAIEMADKQLRDARTREAECKQVICN